MVCPSSGGRPSDWKLTDGNERLQRMEAFGRAFRTADADYWDEFRIWDAAARRED